MLHPSASSMNSHNFLAPQIQLRLTFHIQIPRLRDIIIINAISQ